VPSRAAGIVAFAGFVHRDTTGESDRYLRGIPVNRDSSSAS
jgi:hypothetical protein